MRASSTSALRVSGLSSVLRGEQRPSRERTLREPEPADSERVERATRQGLPTGSAHLLSPTRMRPGTSQLLRGEGPRIAWRLRQRWLHRTYGPGSGSGRGGRPRRAASETGAALAAGGILLAGAGRWPMAMGLAAVLGALTAVLTHSGWLEALSAAC